MSVKVMTTIWENGPDHMTDRFVLLCIADFANDDGEAWPAIASIMRKTTLSDRGVQKSIRRLQEKGWLEIEEGNGRKNTNLYRVKNPERHSPPNEVPPERRSKNPEHGSENPEHGSPNPSRTINNPSAVVRARDDGGIAAADFQKTENPNHSLPKPKTETKTENAASPSPLPPGVPDASGLTQRLIAACGEQNIQGYGALNIGPIYGLLQAGADLETDILPTIQAVSQRLKRPVRGWQYFVGAIQDAYQARIAAGQGIKAMPDTERSEAKWASLLSFARQNSVWDWNALGPAPHEKGCRVPSHLIKPTDGQGWKQLEQAA